MDIVVTGLAWGFGLYITTYLITFPIRHIVNWIRTIFARHQPGTRIVE